MKNFNLTSEIMCEKYFNLFEELLLKKNNIIKNRKFSWVSKYLIKYFPL